jgi:CBS domain-containing protein
MRLSTLGSRSIVSVTPSTSAREVAKVLAERNVGSVLVMNRGHLLGIVTDRDLVLRVIARGLDPMRTTAEAVMSSPVVCVKDEDGAHEAAAAMRENNVRRLPVERTSGGEIVGVVTFDDLVHHLGRTHADLSEVIATFPVPYAGG